MYLATYFNPRARVGRDDVRRRSGQVPRGISIHAPAWGATIHRDDRRITASNFNPRARVGRDKSRATPTSTCGNFNPRARVGRDARRPYISRKTRNFNPRARVGRDHVLQFIRFHLLTFQSTRPRGARR